MRRTIPILAAAALGAACLLASCASAPAADPLDPTAAAATEAPADWTALPTVPPPSAVVPFAPSRVPAAPLALPSDAGSPILLPSSDGGCLAVALVPAAPTGVRVRAIRFDADGRIRWDRTDASRALDGVLTAACLLPGDGFAVGMHVRPDGDATAARDLLLVFSTTGTDASPSDLPALRPGSLERLFALPDGTMLAAGTVPSDAGAASADTDVLLTRFDSSGRPTRTAAIATSASERLMAADCDPAAGLVAVWRTESVPGPSQGSGWTATSRAAAYTADLGLAWDLAPDPDTSLYGARALPDGRGAFLLGLRLVDATGSDTRTVPVLASVDGSGVVAWEFTTGLDGTWFADAIALADGRIAVASSESRATEERRTVLRFLDGLGSVRSAPVEAPGSFASIAPLTDGGLVLVTRQALASLPRPPTSSVERIDTRAVVLILDGALQVVGCRAVDRYKDSPRPDLVVLTTADRLLCG